MRISYVVYLFSHFGNTVLQKILPAACCCNLRPQQRVICPKLLHLRRRRFRDSSTVRCDLFCGARLNSLSVPFVQRDAVCVIKKRVFLTVRRKTELIAALLVNADSVFCG